MRIGEELGITAVLVAQMVAPAAVFFRRARKNRMIACIADLSGRGKGNGVLGYFPCRRRRFWGSPRVLFQALLAGASTAGGGAVMLLMIFSSVLEKPLTIDMTTAAR